MFNDQQRPTDKWSPLSGGDQAGRAKDNIAQLTEMMERETTKTDFARLKWNVDAQYDKATDTILIAEDYRSVMEQEPALLEPLLAHERVHAAYRSDDPVDEASLRAYVDEEMAAYRAEYEAWQRIKTRYTSPEGLAALNPAGRELVHRYEDKMNPIEKAGWDDYRTQWEQEYRRVMEDKK